MPTWACLPGAACVGLPACMLAFRRLISFACLPVPKCLCLFAVPPCTGLPNLASLLGPACLYPLA